MLPYKTDSYLGQIKAKTSGFAGLDHCPHRQSMEYISSNAKK